MGLALRVLDRQGACGAITDQGELLSAEFGVEVAARELEERICWILFDERADDGEGFFILLIVTMEIQREIKTGDGGG